MLSLAGEEAEEGGTLDAEPGVDEEPDPELAVLSVPDEESETAEADSSLEKDEA